MGVKGKRLQPWEIRDEKEEKFKFTEEYIQKALDFFFAHNSIKYNVNNLYIFDWESDKFIETKSGYIYEFEVKISKADFKNDFKNKQDKHIILEGVEKYGDKYIPKYYKYLEQCKKYGKWSVESFHKYNDNNPRYMVAGHKRPNYFYYAVPKGLISVDDVPEYAGLIYVDTPEAISSFSIVKKAPCLHKEKYNDVELNLTEKFYYNWVNYKFSVRKELEGAKLLKEKLDEELKAKGQTKTYKELEEELAHANWELNLANTRLRRQEEDIKYYQILDRTYWDMMKTLQPGFDKETINAIADERYKERYSKDRPTGI